MKTKLFSYALVSLLVPGTLLAQGSEHGGMQGMMMDNMKFQQQMQMMQMMSGQGGGGGGGGSTSYESKREELGKALEQPAKEAQKAMTENVKAMGQETNKMVAETVKSIQASTAKDEPIAENVVAALAPTKGRDLAESRKGVEALIEAQSQLSQVQVQGAQAILEAAQAKEEASVSPDTASAASSEPAGLASASRTVSSLPGLSPDAGGGNHSNGARGFAQGLIHNPPAGLISE